MSTNMLLEINVVLCFCLVCCDCKAIRQQLQYQYLHTFKHQKPFTLMAQTFVA